MAELEEYQIEIKESKDQENFPPEVLIIPIMNSPIFPGMIAPIILSEEKFTQALDSHLMKAGFVALNLVKSDYSESEIEDIPFEEDEGDEDDVRIHHDIHLHRQQAPWAGDTANKHRERGTPPTGTVSSGIGWQPMDADDPEPYL